MKRSNLQKNLLKIIFTGVAVAQQYSVSKINKKYTKSSQVRSPAREIFLKNQDFVPLARMSMVRTMWPHWAKFLPLGLLCTWPIFTQPSSFNTRFAVGIQRFQKWFDVDVLGFEIKILRWYFGMFGLLFLSIGWNFIQSSGATGQGRDTHRERTSQLHSWCRGRRIFRTF